MATQVIPHSLRRALYSFRVAENEFNRPTEDVVAVCACSQMRGSVEDFLRSYLRSSNAAFTQQDYFEDLLSRCRKIDSQFQEIDLSCFYCNQERLHAREQYCLSHNKMKDCFIQTQLVKNLVLAKLNLSEKDFG